MEEKYKKQWDFTVSAAVTVILFVIISLYFDSVYCINDDLLIQSILSGRYSGSASGMTVYFSQPLSGLLAFFYHIMPDVPWFGVFLEGCYIICFFVVLYFSIIRVNNIHEIKRAIVLKICICILCVAAFAGFFLGQYLLPHYTVAAAVVGGTALYLLLISKDSREWKETARQMWLPVVLLLFCYLIRTKVFFMVLPFLGAAGIYRMVKTRSVMNYFFPIGLLCGGILVLMLIGNLSYNNAAWKEYIDYNDARTELYDYAGIWEENAASDYYLQQGYTPEEISIYLDYNVLLDEELTAEDYRVLASYAEMRPDGQRTMVQKLKDGFWLYRNRELETTEDSAYSNMTLVLYLLAIVLMAAGRDYKSLFPLVLLGGARSLVWVYLLSAGRYPERVIVSLYLVELMVLLAMIANAAELLIVSSKGQGMKAEDEKTAALLGKKPYRIMRQTGAVLAYLLLFVLSIETAGRIMPDALERSRQQIITNTEEDRLYDFMKSHPENLYLLDVYAVVNRTEYVFKDYDKSYENYILLGGWAAGSPLTADKLADWGYGSAFEALFEGGNIYLVLKDGVGMTLDDWQQYYTGRGKGEESFLLIEIIETETGTFRIYQRYGG